MSHSTARLETDLTEREAPMPIVLPSPVLVEAPVKAAAHGSVLRLVAAPRRLSGIGPSVTDRRH